MSYARFCLAVAGLFPASVSQAQQGSIDLGDARIHYEITGRGEPVVLLHGWALNMRAWDDQVTAFERHYRVVRYDRRGFGRSSGYMDVTADPADLAALLDTLGIGSAHVLGHSQGAVVALSFAVAYPQRVRSLILYGSGPPVGFPVLPPERNRRAVARDIARQHGLDSARAYIFGETIARIPPERPDLREQIRSLAAAYSGRDLIEERAQSGRVPRPHWDRLPEVRVPTLILIGEGEQAYSKLVADSLARAFPNVRKVVIPGGGHGVHFDQPERFNEAVLDFLKDAMRTRPKKAPR